MQEWAQGKPVGTTVDHDGNVWVPDTHYHRVIVFNPQGDELKRFALTTSSGRYPSDQLTVLTHRRKAYRIGRINIPRWGVRRLTQRAN